MDYLEKLIAMTPEEAHAESKRLGEAMVSYKWSDGTFGDIDLSKVGGFAPMNVTTVYAYGDNGAEPKDQRPEPAEAPPPIKACRHCGQPNA